MSKNQKPSQNQAVILELAKRAGFTGISAREITALEMGDDEYDPIRDNRVMASVSRSLRRLTRRMQLIVIVTKGKRRFYDVGLIEKIERAQQAQGATPSRATVDWFASVEQVAKDAAQAAVEEIRGGARVG